MDHNLRKKTKISCADNLYLCPANSRDVESKYKHNIVKHLKMCVELKKKRNTVANNEVCPACFKVFAQKSNAIDTLTHFSPMSHIYTYGFLTFSGGIEM